MKLKDLLEKYKEYEVKEGFLDFLEKPKQTIWDLQEGDTYWWIDGQVRFSFWNGYNVDDIRQESGNCFLTQEEAEKELKKQKIEALLKKYADGYQWKSRKKNYCLFYDSYNRVVYVDCHMTIKTSGVIYFSTKEKANRAVEKIGTERIIKDYFQIEEE